MMGEVQKRGLLYELKGGYRIDMTEEEYREKREELGRIAARHFSQAPKSSRPFR